MGREKPSSKKLCRIPPSPSLAGYGFPLKDYAAKPGKTWLPPLVLPG